MVRCPACSSQLVVTPAASVPSPTMSPRLLIPVAVVLTSPGILIAVNTPVAA
jgi:hypothetical protein